MATEKNKQEQAKPQKKKTSSSKKTASNSSTSSKKKTSFSNKKSSSKKTTSSQKKAATAKKVSNSSKKKAKVTPKTNTNSKKTSSKKKNVESKRKPKQPKRRLDNIEVRNSHAQANKKRKRIKFVKPPKKVDEPHIYDEAKYLKTLKKRGKKNLQIIMSVFLGLFLISVGFIIKLEITHAKNGNNLSKYAQDTYTETTNVDSTRGAIYDTNGEALAINLEVYDLTAVTDKGLECQVDDTYENCALDKADVAEGAKNIATALELDGDDQKYIEERINYGLSEEKYQVSFGSLGKNITLSQKKALEKLDYPWLAFEPQELRFYPYGDFASYIIGYTTTDDETKEISGALGVEKALDGHLKGQDGVVTSQFDNYGIELTEEQQSAIQKVDGTDVYLTLDSVIQTYLESSMEKALSTNAMKDITYDGLFTIVMDAKTGDILAAQSNPSFDPNVREIENYTNFFTDYCFEPGSTFKAATIAAADEAGVWEDNTTEPTGSRSASTWGGLTIKDWNNGVGWGNLTWDQGFYMSSNTVMTYIMDKIPDEFWTEFVTKKLLIGTPVETQFIETPSCVFNPNYDVEYATTSFGQGMTVNALQMLRMYSALVGDGNMVTPHIVQDIKDSETGETIYTDEDLEVIPDVVSSDTSEHIRNLLDGVVNYNNGVISGTGNHYQDTDYAIGMKTGTAQIVGDNGKYLANDYLHSAMAVAPVDDPQIIMYSVVIKPSESSIINDAVPTYMKEVFDNTLSYMNSENRVVDLEQENEMYDVENFIGTDISEAADEKTIKVGSGEIKAQYPKAGQRVTADQRVVLFGTESLEFPDITGYTYNETVAVCNNLDVTCEFENTGTTVASVTNESEKKYKIKME